MPTLGRGGAGNIQAVEEQNARIAEDLEANLSAKADPPPSQVPPPLDTSDKEEQQYNRTGRGGAGNYYNTQDAELPRVEATTPDPLSFLVPAPVESSAEKDEQLYSRTGRGGAGNYYSAQDLEQAQDVKASKPKVAKQPIANETMRTYGRGGLGNYAIGAMESAKMAEKKRVEDEMARRKVRQEVERGVEEGLAMPQKAKLSQSQLR